MGFLYSQLFVTPPVPTTPLQGQTHIITGSNTGLGFTAAEHIARLSPSHLILAVRSLEKGAKARDAIIASTGIAANAISVWQLDMSSFSSVVSFANRCASDLDRLDGVSLNAGVQTSVYTDHEGYESTVLINVISTFLLAVLLLPTLRKSGATHNISPRLSIVSSETHAWASWPEKSTPQGQSILKAMSDPQNQITQFRYMDTKLMQILVFRHLHKLLVASSQSGAGGSSSSKGKVILNILNPGFCYSTLNRDGPQLIHRTMLFVLGRSTEVGGRPIAAGLVAGWESDGKYMHDGVADEGALSAYVKSDEGEKMGARLWEELKVVLEDVKKGCTEGL